MADYHLAQLNIGRIVAPMDSETMYGFASRLDEINALADAADGFVWRLQTEEGNATTIHVFDDDMLLVNMSVWESIEALHEFTYKSTHVELLRDRKQWFSHLDKPYMVLWWIPEGHIPTTDEAKAKLNLLTEQGVTPLAFTFTKRFTIEEMLAAQVTG
jgi:hypothetical protein